MQPWGGWSWPRAPHLQIDTPGGHSGAALAWRFPPLVSRRGTWAPKKPAAEGRGGGGIWRETKIAHQYFFKVDHNVLFRAECIIVFENIFKMFIVGFHRALCLDHDYSHCCCILYYLHRDSLPMCVCVYCTCFKIQSKIYALHVFISVTLWDRNNYSNRHESGSSNADSLRTEDSYVLSAKSFYSHINLPPPHT